MSKKESIINLISRKFYKCKWLVCAFVENLHNSLIPHLLSISFIWVQKKVVGCFIIVVIKNIPKHRLVVDYTNHEYMYLYQIQW